VGEQRADLALADTRPAMYGEDRSLVRAGLEDGSEDLPEAGEDGRRLGDVTFADLHLVTRHVTGGDRIEVFDRRGSHDIG